MKWISVIKTYKPSRKELLQSFRYAIYTMFWLLFLTFPFVVMKNDSINQAITWRWGGFIAMALASFLISFLWYSFSDHARSKTVVSSPNLSGQLQSLFSKRSIRVLFVVFVLVFPFLLNLYNVGIMTTALIYIILGLGLNIIIGWGGLLNLGYAAFFSIGAYTYALLYKYAGIGFWPALPLGGIVAALFGVLLSFPVLRLRGDYLAIVTLAFSEIVRIVLTNLSDITGGPDGISQIPRPNLFSIDLTLKPALILTYFIALAGVFLTVFIVRRIENSRWGRAWEAMREDEIAAESMGVNITHAKVSVFVLGSFFAGIAGVMLAAKTTKVTPDSFGLLESVIVLCIVVLGGMGSVPGVIAGALILKLLPEYFRALSTYRMLVFGLVLVLMMVFKPEGLIPKIRKRFTIKPANHGDDTHQIAVQENESKDILHKEIE